MKTDRPRKRETGRCDWQAGCDLPSLAVLERLSKPGGGPAVQAELFPERPDNSRAGRLARLLALPGVTTASGMFNPVLPPKFPGDSDPKPENVASSVAFSPRESDNAFVGQSSAAGKGSLPYARI